MKGLLGGWEGGIQTEIDNDKTEKREQQLFCFCFVLLKQHNMDEKSLCMDNQ